MPKNHALIPNYIVSSNTTSKAFTPMPGSFWLTPELKRQRRSSISWVGEFISLETVADFKTGGRMRAKCLTFAPTYTHELAT